MPSGGLVVSSSSPLPMRMTWVPWSPMTRRLIRIRHRRMIGVFFVAQ